MNEEPSFTRESHAFQLIKSDQKKALSLFLPSASYHTDQPIFYYIAQLLTSQKGPVLKANNSNIPLEAITEVFEQQRKYFDPSSFFLVAKSSGTIQAGYLINQLPALKNASVVWITPFINDSTLFQQMLNYRGKSLVILSKEDWSYHESKVAKLQAKENYTVVIMENANHDLESPEKLNIHESLANLELVLQAVAAFADIQLPEFKN